MDARTQALRDLSEAEVEARIAWRKYKQAAAVLTQCQDRVSGHKPCAAASSDRSTFHVQV